MLLMRVAWLIVLLVGVLVLGIVFSFQLFHRLDAGQKVLDGAEAAFVDERVEGARAGITIVSDIVDLADPIVLADPVVAASAADEVPQLIKFVSDNSVAGLSEAEVLAALQENVPHTTALLLAIPLEEVTAELPDLIALVASVTGLSEEEVLAAIVANFPGIAQAITALPIVTADWNDVKSVDRTGSLELTRFDGETPVSSVPDVRDYFSEDVIPVLENQRDNFQDLNETWPTNLRVIPRLLVAIGGLVVFFGGLMFVVTGRMRS